MSPKKRGLDAGDAEARACGKCGKSGATARCGRCKSVWYCDSSCQKAAWAAHKAACVAATTAPSAAVACFSCAASGATTRCARCKSAWYCDASCQKAAWPAHKGGCVPVTTAPPPPPPPFMASDEFLLRQPPPQPEGHESRSSDGEEEEEEEEDDADEVTAQLHAERGALQATYQHGASAFRQGRWRDARASLVAARAMCGSLADWAMQADCDRMLGYCCSKLRDSDQAEVHFRAAVATAEKLAAPHVEAAALVGLGTCLGRSGGAVEEAKRYLERACALAQMADDASNEAAACSNLGTLLLRGGSFDDPKRARKLLEHAVALRHTQLQSAATAPERQEAQRALAGTLTNLAGVLLATGGADDPRAAMSTYKLALEAANEVGDADTAAKILTQLSNLYEHEVPGGAAAAAVARTDLARIMTEAFHRSAPDTCSICLDAMDVLATTADETQRITVLECYHFLHTRCLQSLQKASAEQGTVDGRACPECKHRLTYA